MKTQKNLNQYFFIALAIMAIFVSGCNYLADPTEDKETGEKINLLVLDFNFFHTRMTYKLVDAKTGEVIKTNATVTFSGKNANDIVSYTGKKNENYETTEGQLELTIDPNINISTSSPLEFSANVVAEGYNTLSKGISINSEGIKTIELNLAKKTDEIDTDLTGGISLLGNFNFTRNFYLSAGVLFNSFNPKITGDAASGLEYGDIIIPPSMVGDFEFTIEPQLQVSPYGSVGFRSFFGKNKRVVLNTELGMYYMGPPKINISASGLLAPTADPAHGQKEILENQIEQYKFYPVLKLILAVKLF
jgi:hypothetical protein